MKRIVYLIIFIFVGCVSENKNNETASLHLQLAIGLMEKDNYPQALKELLIAQDYDPNNYVVQSHLGYIYFQRERYDLSEHHYKNALKIKPDYSEAKNFLARTYIEISQYKLAEKLLDEVIHDYTYGEFAKTYLHLGILEFKRKNYKLSIDWLNKSLETARENCETHVYLGRDYLELQNKETAIDILNKATVFCKKADLDDAHYYSAIALYRNNEKDLSVIRFNELLKIFPSGKNRENARKMLELIKKGNL